MKVRKIRRGNGMVLRLELGFRSGNELALHVPGVSKVDSRLSCAFVAAILQGNN